MEDKQYLIEAIRASAANTAANLKLTGKSLTKWDAIINKTITEIENDTYSPSSTYSTPKQYIFGGYDDVSLKTLADQMVTLIKNSKKKTSVSSSKPKASGSKYTSVYDWEEEWDNGYTHPVVTDPTNTDTFSGLIDSVMKALDEVSKLDDKTYLKNFKKSKSDITSIKSQLNDLKNSGYSTDNYKTLMSILNDLGVSGDAVNAFFKLETPTIEDNTSTITPGTISINYNGKTVKYYDDPFSEDYGKIIYGDKTYKDLNELSKATQDTNLIKTIIDNRNKNNERFEIYDLNNLTSFYDLTFDNNGKYYDVSAVYNIPGFEYILAKTDNINKTKWEDLELYGVKDGKIIKIDQLPENWESTWYNYDYDPNDLKKLLNKRDIGTQKADASMMKELSEIEKKGFPFDNKTIKNGEYVSAVWNLGAKNPRDSEVIEAFLNSLENGDLTPFLDFFKKGAPTEEQQKDFFTKLYNSANLKLKQRLKNIMEDLNIFKKGGILKFTGGGKSEENEVGEKIPVYTQQELENSYDDYKKKSFMSNLFDFVSGLSPAAAMAAKNKKIRIIAALAHSVPAVITDINEGTFDENTLATIINGVNLAINPNQKTSSSKKARQLAAKAWPFISHTLNGYTQIANLKDDGLDWSDIGAAAGIVGSVYHGYRNIKQGKQLSKNTSTSKPASTSESTVGLPYNKQGGQLNYLKIF